MKKWFPKTDEFYIGYIPEAPGETALVIRKVILIILFLIITLAFLLVWFQKEFSSTNFEYGVNTQVEGYIFSNPIPHLLLPLGKTNDKKEIYQTILLVGVGKSGADGIIHYLQKNSEKKLDGIKVKLNGYLLYGDGKALLQVNEEDNKMIEFLDEHLQAVSQDYEAKIVTLSGEIVDPKCYFGVMKPGEGKVHRSCAIRCIAGGIPPVFHSDTSDYFVLVNEHNEPIHMDILNLVGDHITLIGKAVTWNDWKILKIDTENIRHLSNAKKKKEVLLAFEKGITLCQ
jgi:hypothetical protein